MKAASKLGVSVTFIAAASAALWGRSLSDERDARAGEAGLPEDRSARPKVLGHVTRRLLADLSAELDAAEQRATRRGKKTTKKTTKRSTKKTRRA